MSDSEVFRHISCAHQGSDVSKRSKLTIVEAESGDKMYTGILVAAPAPDGCGRKWRSPVAVWFDDDALDRLRDHISAIRGRHAEALLQGYREELDREEL